MEKRIKPINAYLLAVIAVGLIGTSYQGYKVWQISQVNNDIRQGRVVKSESYPFLQKFTAAYIQGKNRDFKHAVQSYGQIIDSKTLLASLASQEQASIHYNIGNNLFLSGLLRGLNDDGTIKEESKYGFKQAKIAYEQALRLNPDSRVAKFNLSLVNTVIPLTNNTMPKDQSGVELSNLPIGLP